MVACRCLSVTHGNVEGDAGKLHDGHSARDMNDRTKHRHGRHGLLDKNTKNLLDHSRVWPGYLQLDRHNGTTPRRVMTPLRGVESVALCSITEHDGGVSTVKTTSIGTKYTVGCSTVLVREPQLATQA